MSKPRKDRPIIWLVVEVSLEEAKKMWPQEEGWGSCESSTMTDEEKVKWIEHNAPVTPESPC